MLFAPDYAGSPILSRDWHYLWKQASRDVLESIAIVQTGGLSSSHQSLGPSMSQVSSRYSRSLSLLSRIVFEDGVLSLPTLPVFTGWLRSCILNLMHRWSLKVVTPSTHQSPILEARRDAAICLAQSCRFWRPLHRSVFPSYPGGLSTQATCYWSHPQWGSTY